MLGQDTGNLTNEEKFQEVFGRSLYWLLFKVYYSGLMKWLGMPYKGPERSDVNG